MFLCILIILARMIILIIFPLDKLGEEQRMAPFPRAVCEASRGTSQFGIRPLSDDDHSLEKDHRPKAEVHLATWPTGPGNKKDEASHPD